ncbi:hypothetical protein PRIPAC_93963 [Pristionchus pacificus]|uniref:Uncharacterized protein n=1 Tax=Pristionchus pacificus TaxID=54126 RepID=A0A2A6BA34_PRIPA|nr:hypothetical protein PRIPAC_93963 [Pristionchus pacificus]|eukprot:PDM62724.1 hypothetical protein PRIPAC_49939 [Pristionchus pacificus]
MASSVYAVTPNECYKNWSRCTPQTSAGTGILWKSCDFYCKMCKSRDGGNCVPIVNAPCSGGQKCECFGGNRDWNPNWAQRATCWAGL